MHPDLRSCASTQNAKTHEDRRLVSMTMRKRETLRNRPSCVPLGSYRRTENLVLMEAEAAFNVRDGSLQSLGMFGATIVTISMS